MAKMFDDNWSRNQSYAGWRVGAPGAMNKPGIANTMRRQARRRIPVRQILLFILAVVSFKIFLFLELGGATYGAKMVALSEGNMLEQIAGRAMALDPVSKWVVDGVRFGSW